MASVATKLIPLDEEKSSDINSSDYDTKLSPKEEAIFQGWKQKYAPHDSGYDYDLRGAFKAGLQPGVNGHWDDTFKKPNHPTFSTYSKYAKDRPDLAGTWQGEKYIPPKSKGIATRLVPLDDTESTAEETPNLAEGTSPQDLLKNLAPSSVLRQAGVASVNAPGAMGAFVNSLPGVGNPANIMPAVQNLASNPGQIPDSVIRASQVQVGSPLTSQEKVPAVAGQVAGTAMELGAMPSADTSGVKATNPFMAGVKAPSTALPGAFDEAGQALGEAKTAAGAGVDATEVDDLLTRLEDPKEAKGLLTEARKWVSGGMKEDVSIPKMLAYKQALGEAQAEGGAFSNVYASASRKISAAIKEKAPDLSAKLDQMATNYAARGNPNRHFPWLTFAFDPAVGLAKAAFLPGVQNTVGALAGKAAQNIGRMASVASQFTGPSKKDTTSHDLEVRIYQSLKSGEHSNLANLKRVAEDNNLNFSKLLAAAQKGYSQEKTGKSGFRLEQIVGPDMANQLRNFGK